MQPEPVQLDPFQSKLALSGLLIATIECDPEEFDKVRVVGMERKVWLPDEGRAVCERPNKFVDLGLQIALDRIFGINGPPAAPTGIAVSPDDQAVPANTTLLDPATGDTGFVRKAFSPALSAGSRSGNVVTAGATFTEADVTFAINKVGLLNTATDAGTGLFDVIGGASNNPFTIDLTGVTSFSLNMQIAVTASAT